MSNTFSRHSSRRIINAYVHGACVVRRKCWKSRNDEFVFKINNTITRTFSVRDFTQQKLPVLFRRHRLNPVPFATHARRGRGKNDIFVGEYFRLTIKSLVPRPEQRVPFLTVRKRLTYKITLLVGKRVFLRFQTLLRIILRDVIAVFILLLVLHGKPLEISVLRFGFFETADFDVVGFRPFSAVLKRRRLRNKCKTAAYSIYRRYSHKNVHFMNVFRKRTLNTAYTI